MHEQDESHNPESIRRAAFPHGTPMNTARPEFGAGKTRMRKGAKVPNARAAARDQRLAKLRTEAKASGRSVGDDFRPDTERGMEGTDKMDEAKPKPPTKLPKGPSEGSLTPADRAAPDAVKRPKMTQAEQSAEFERIAREHGAEGDEETFERVF